MCGRFVAPDAAAIERAWSLRPTDRLPLLPDRIRYNVTPGSYVPVMVSGEGQRLLKAMRWGLVPPWAGEAETGQNMINARSETVAEKSAFRSALRKRRGLVPALGWYEWQRLGAKGKQPWFIEDSDHEPLAFAAIWEHKHLSATEVLATVSLLTRPASEDVSHIHHRMPVVFHADEQEKWLHDGDMNGDQLGQMALDLGRTGFASHRVSSRVNKPGNDDEKLIEPEHQEVNPQADLWDN